MGISQHLFLPSCAASIAIRRREERRDQSLQAIDESVRLVRALLLLGDLLVLHCDLVAQEFVLALQQIDDAGIGRDKLRQGFFCRHLS